MPNKNGPLTLNIGTYLRICHLNIEGISKAKCEILSKIMIDNKVDVIALQETHTTDEADLQKRGYIAGYTLIGAINHKQYGIATYVKNDIDTANVIYRSHLNNIEILVTIIDSITIINVYKPPNANWENPPVKLFDHPAVYIGNFNSHNSDWGYDQNDDNGEVLQEWIALHNLELNYNAKDMGTFRSARWRKDYTPDLSITSRNTLDGPTIATRHILANTDLYYWNMA